MSSRLYNPHMKRLFPLLSFLLACSPMSIVTESTGLDTTTGADATTTGSATIVSETDPNTSAPEFCSDTIREPWEECDDGKLLGGYDGCEPQCKRGPHCGDGVIDVGHEVCDGGEGCPLDCGVKGCEEISP